MNYLTAFLLLISFGFRRAIAFETRSQLHRHTTASNESACTFSQFPQAIDHFGKTNGTLQQRYNLVPEFFETGGPILFFQGEEGRHLDCVVSQETSTMWLYHANHRRPFRTPLSITSGRRNLKG